MKKIQILLALTISLAVISCQGQKNIKSSKKNEMEPSSIHQFKVKSLEGGLIDFSAFKGKKILVVNTATHRNTRTCSNCTCSMGRNW
jgi:hypothetical protein